MQTTTTTTTGAAAANVNPLNRAANGDKKW
jgi:hypothetical protein